MAAGFPLGAFARDRLDWGIGQLMLGGCYGPQASTLPRIGLYNNSASGNYLAVYGVLPVRTTSNKFASVGMIQGGDAAASAAADNAFTQPIVTGMPALDGYITLSSQSLTYVLNGVTCAADGRSWLTMRALPLFVIPPGYSVVCVMSAFGTIQATQWEPFAVTFLWGYFEESSPPATTLGAA